jgi:hypothetical protein
MGRRGAAAAIILWTRAASADPAIGGTVQLGQSLGGEAAARLGTTIYALASIDPRWFAGGELSGSIEGYYGSWGCGTAHVGPHDLVPAVGVVCARPSLGLHLLAGAPVRPSPWSELRLSGGVGGTVLWLVPGRGGASRASLVPSGLIRIDLLVLTGGLLGADWWAGAALEERTLAFGDVRLSASAALLFEGRSR